MNGQLLLFYASPRSEDAPRTRQGDPSTSRQAARKLARCEGWKTQKQIVLETMRRCNGGTHAEIAALTTLDWVTVTKRLPELERDSLVRRGTPRICHIKGSSCTTWWLTGDEARDE